MSSKNAAFPKGLLLSVAGFLHQRLESPPRSLTCSTSPPLLLPSSTSYTRRGGPRGQRRPMPLEHPRWRSPFEQSLCCHRPSPHREVAAPMAHSPCPALGNRLGIRMSVLSHKCQPCSKVQSSSTARPTTPWQRPARTLS